MNAALVYSNDDNFSLAIEFLRASVRQRQGSIKVHHQVWYQPPIEGLSSDYLGHYNRFLAKLFHFEPDVIAFSVYVWNYDEFARMSEMAKRFVPGVKVLWGGAQANSRKVAVALLHKHSCIDFVLRGESEESYPEFLQCIGADDDLSQVPGLSWRKDNEIIHNSDAEQVNLAKIPMVFTENNFPLAPYLAKTRIPTLAYETGRGCRQKCKFCLYGIPSLRAFAMDRVEKELRYLLQGRIPLLRICDAHFGISRKRSMELFEIIAAHNANTIVDIYPDTKHVDREYVIAMNKAGCRVVSLGIQSSDPETLAISGRRFDEATFANAAQLIRENHNQKLSGDIILGLPGDNYERLKESIHFAYRNGIEYVHFAPLMAFPGVEFFEKSEDYAIEHFDFAPPIVVQSNTFNVADYKKSMTLASHVEKLQQELPTLIKALIYLSPSAPVDFAEKLAALDIELEDRLLHQNEFYSCIQAAFTDDESLLLTEAIQWDRMTRQQRSKTPRRLLNLFGHGAQVKTLATENVVRLSYPIHMLGNHRRASKDSLTRGKWCYLFPPGGSAVYLFDDLFENVLQQAEPGLTLDDWVSRTVAGNDHFAGEAARARDLIRLLYLSEIVEIESTSVSVGMAVN